MRTVASKRTARSRGARVTIPAPTVRCAVYTRKSTSEGLDSDFNTLDAQREACEAYIKSQRATGWVALGDSYDDGGFTGGNTERPALKRLLADIAAGEVGAVIVYKIDRLSRSLLDFLKLIELFDDHGVAFVSVTQQINTATSAGKLMLHILASFAAYERSLISERTSDKMCAARRKGKWLGGPPILGYDLDRDKHRLMVNPDEAALVREMFDLYLKYQSTLKVAVELNRRSWTTKSWVRKDGTRVSGARWDKARVLRHLTSVTYTGTILHKGEIYDGEHEAIVTDDVFAQVQTLVDLNGNGRGPAVRNKHGALLKGLLRCGRCGAAMAHTYTKKKDRLYRYYACSTKQKQGASACDTPSLAAQDVEDFVVQQIRQIGKDPTLVEEVYTETVRQQEAVTPALEAEHRQLLHERQRRGEEINRLITVLAETDTPLASVAQRLRDAEVAVAQLDLRLAELKDQITHVRSQTVDADHLRETLAQFDPIWDVLHPQERITLVQQVVESAVYDPDSESIQLTLRRSQA